MKKHIYLSLIFAILSITAIAEIFIIQKTNGEIIELPTENIVEMKLKEAEDTPDDNTPDYVEIIDLGLSVNWASTNLGATLPGEPGYLLAWGELEEKDWYSWSYYKFGTSKTSLTKYTAADGLSILQAEDDAATMLWGGEWRMPSREEFQELYDNCEVDYEATEDGYPGVRFTSKVPGYEGKSIFLCAAGWIQDEYHVSDVALSSYWTNQCVNGEVVLPEFAFAAEFWRQGDYAKSYYCSGTYRYLGRPVRAVRVNENYAGPVEDPTFAGDFEIYLNPSNVWNAENGWFTLYVNNSNTDTNEWVTLTDTNEDGIYEGMVPQGEWTSMAFYQIRNEYDTPSNSTALSKTEDYFYDGVNNQCNILSIDMYGVASAEWVIYTEPIIEPVEVEYVDLGLTVNWASYNVGATSPEEYGYFLSWGELEEKDWYSWSYYKFGTSKTSLTKYCTADNKNTLEAEDDIATVMYGEKWRMPSREEFQELVDYCNVDYTAIENGVPGIRFTSKVPGYEDKSVFFPAAGYKQDGSIVGEGASASLWCNGCILGGFSLPEYAFTADLIYGGNYSSGSALRVLGRSVRAVSINEDYVEPIIPEPLPTFEGNFNAYLNIGDQWSTDNAWFALQVINENENTSAWATMTDNHGYGTYECLVPEGDWTGMIFTRQDNSNDQASIENALAKTETLIYDGTNNQYNISGLADNGAYIGNWSVYKEPVPTFVGGATIYLNPTETWTIDNAWFALYVFNANNDTNAWATFANPDANGVVNTSIPEGEWSGLIFVRMNPETATPSWDFQWGQTADLFLDATNNQFNITGWGDDGKATGDWSIYTEPVVEPATPEYVDLGLSVNWANINVGATSVEDSGYFVSWGETEEKEVYSWSTYKYGTGSTSMTKYCKSDKISVLEAMDDAATAVFGEDWRTPTQAEFQELIDNCTIEYITAENGVNGVRLTSNIEGYTDKSIFLPCGGYKQEDGTMNGSAYGDYWTSECKTSLLAQALAYTARFSILGKTEIATQDKIYGRNVRAVKAKEVVVEPVPTFVGGATIYLNPTETWTKDNAWFALYVFNANNDTNAWTTFANPDANGVVNTSIPEGEWSGLIFVRMNPETATPSWDFQWGQTADLFLDATNNQFNITGWGDDGKATGEWSIYTEPVVEPTAPEYVDLGLSVNWATCNVGATSSEDSGYFVSWGETEEKEVYSWDTYKHGTGKMALTKYYKSDKISTLESVDDAATAAMGEDWRTPTKSEWQELIDNCDIEYITTENGVNGVRLTSKIEGYTDKSIFFPCGGYKQETETANDKAYADYWTAECQTSMLAQYLAHAVRFSMLGSCEIATQDKIYGRNVRAVKAK